MCPRCVLSLVACCGLGLARPVAAQGLIVLAADAWCPFNCPLAAPQPGFGVDIARAVFEPLGYRVEYRVMPWSRAIEGARAGQLTGILSAPKSEQLRGFVFSREPVGMMQNALFKRRDLPWQYTGLASLQFVDIGFVQGYVFGGEIGRYLAQAAAAKAANIQLATGAAAGEHNITKLARGRVQLIAEDVSVVAYQCAALHLTEPFEIAASLGEREPIYIAFAPQGLQSQDFADALDAGIRQLRTSCPLRPERLAERALRQRA